VEYSKDQSKAIGLAYKWWNDSSAGQTWTLTGFAGTGKTVLISAIMELLGLSDFQVKFLAPTGKAALVMTRKGNSGSTIHSFIYEVVIKPIYNERGIRVGETKEWTKKPFIPQGVELIIVDEVSMVSSEIMEDLKSFGIRMICVGDAGQLPPVKDKDRIQSGPSILSGYDMLMKPDATLVEIHRQAADNPIIHLSMLAREGRKIQTGMYGGDKAAAAVIPKAEVEQSWLLRADCVIVGTNRTRHDFNVRMRHALGRGACVLPEKGDKLICTKNDWSTEVNGTPLINGLVGYCLDDVWHVDERKRRIAVDFRPDFFPEDGPYFDSSR
jgi:exodeoxyribonuclease-5